MYDLEFFTCLTDYNNHVLIHVIKSCLIWNFTGSRELMDPPQGKCLLIQEEGMTVQEEGMTVRRDQSTFCSCVNSTSVCRRETCPPLNCPVERQFYAKHDSSCMQCPAEYEKKAICQIGEKVYRVSNVNISIY